MPARKRKVFVFCRTTVLPPIEHVRIDSSANTLCGRKVEKDSPQEVDYKDICLECATRHAYLTIYKEWN